MRVRTLISCCAFLLLAHPALHGQDAMTRLRIAQGFEQSNDWERAADMYESLHRTDPANYIYYDGLLRSWTQLKNYPRAVTLVEERIRLFPNDLLLVATLGGVLYDAGREREADSVWRSATAREPGNGPLYRVIATEQLDRRLLDRAIATFRAGRQATGNDMLFADELGGLYSAMQEYETATSEFLRLLSGNPQQLSYIESRIASFTSRAEGLAGARAAVSRSVGAQPGDITLRSLSAWLAMESKDYTRAYREYLEIDRLARANGNELLRFAQRCSAEGAFATAARAFSDVLGAARVANVVTAARLGYARAVEELSLTDTTHTVPRPLPAGETVREETVPSAGWALQLYEQLAADVRFGDPAAQAWYRIGVISFERLFDLDRAVRAFRQAREAFPNSPVAHDASLRLADVHIVRNDLAAARADLRTLTATPHTYYQDLSAVRLAELEYFQGNFDAALQQLQRFNGALATDAANDALQLQYFIQENVKADPVGLAAFAAADLLSRQRRAADALARFQQLAAGDGAPSLVDDATFRVGDLQLQLGKTTDALATFGRIARDMPSSILKDKAQFRIGEIAERSLRDPQRAVAAYEELLAKFPTSLYAEEARTRVRLLRNPL